VSEEGAVGDQAEGSITIAAPAADIMDVIEDFESYPDWAGVESAEVLERDAGRASAVAFRLSAPLIGSVRYTLTYEYRDDDEGVSWSTREIDGQIRDIQGEYLLEELDVDETRVTYRLAVDLALPVPGFMRKQAGKSIVKTALDGLKRRVEER
jgi:uncharacterized membrane protein